MASCSVNKPQCQTFCAVFLYYTSEVYIYEKYLYFKSVLPELRNLLSNFLLCRVCSCPTICMSILPTRHSIQTYRTFEKFGTATTVVTYTDLILHYMKRGLVEGKIGMSQKSKWAQGIRASAGGTSPQPPEGGLGVLPQKNFEIWVSFGAIWGHF